VRLVQEQRERRRLKRACGRGRDIARNGRGERI
jgi:hypothetical protein